MIRVSQLKLPVEHSEEQFYQKIEKSLKIKKDQIKKLQIVKKYEIAIIKLNEARMPTLLRNLDQLSL